MNQQSDQEENEFEISKSQVKRDMEALQKLGVKLMGMNKQQLDSLPLTESIEDAIAESKRITSNEAKRRHGQYVGKLIRKADYEAIIQAVEMLDPSSEAFSRFYQQVEKWRDKMTADLQTSMTEFLGQFPETDRQHLRQLGKNAEKEVQKKPDTWVARKKLFQFLKECMTTR